jgi:hypothetical protein
LRGAVLDGLIAVFRRVQTSGRHSDGTYKDFPLPVHRSAFPLIWVRFYAKQSRGGCITYTGFRTPGVGQLWSGGSVTCAVQNIADYPDESPDVEKGRGRSWAVIWLLKLSGLW